MKKLKLFIADDHTIFRKAMVNMLQGFERVEEVKDAENGKELLELMKFELPDVAIIDLQMPVMDGVEASKKIISKYPKVKIVILTMVDSEQYIIHMVEMGVHAFLLKNTDPDELETAIYSVFDNDYYNNEIVTNALRKNTKAKSIFSSLNRSEISEREKEVIALICQELTNKEIAENLNLSERTIENHRYRIMEKLGIKNTVGLVKYALETKLIS
jgi:two-component system, NarL family, response regulator DegU